MNFLYPSWLEAHIIADEHMAAAYENTEGHARAALKQTIAVQHCLWGEPPFFEERMRAFASFAVQEQQSPAPYALIVADADNAKPTAFLGAILPAVLAGVERILACFTGESALPQAGLLAALELAGVDKAFMLTEGALRTLVDDMSANLGQGRLACLGLDELAEDLAALAIKKEIPFMHLPGNATCLPQEAAFSRGADEAADAPLLVLGPEYENVWVWPQLGPHWFCTRRMHIFSS